MIGVFVYYITQKGFELRSVFLEESYFSGLKAESHIATLTPTEKLLTIFSNSAYNFPTCKKLVTYISTSCSMYFNFNALISTCVECMWSGWKTLRNRNAALFTEIDEF